MLELVQEKSIEEKNIELNKSNNYLQSKIELYENGDAKLYYAIQRKMSEMAKSLNKVRLDEIELQDKANATFDRMFKLLEKCEVISASAASLGQLAGITGDEKKDTTKIRKAFTPEMAADQVGELAGKKQ